MNKVFRHFFVLFYIQHEGMAGFLLLCFSTWKVHLSMPTDLFSLCCMVSGASHTVGLVLCQLLTSCFSGLSLFQQQQIHPSLLLVALLVTCKCFTQVPSSMGAHSLRWFSPGQCLNQTLRSIFSFRVTSLCRMSASLH